MFTQKCILQTAQPQAILPHLRSSCLFGLRASFASSVGVGVMKRVVPHDPSIPSRSPACSDKISVEAARADFLFSAAKSVRAKKLPSARTL